MRNLASRGLTLRGHDAEQSRWTPLSCPEFRKRPTINDATYPAKSGDRRQEPHVSSRPWVTRQQIHPIRNRLFLSCANLDARE
ncbi:hypothetical protein MAR_020565 [Mya arenaria]|uniref:Uncharacterized protein n=1 Tax=Mya arenaria TaxID=6604 RepID=A0ABY7E8F2_MYAAR|nr:hypothetical protein MAR_020565 [Mya arenaria]